MSDTFCCRYCGRDTKAQDQICWSCRGEQPRGSHEAGKMRGRKSRNLEAERQSPIDSAEGSDPYYITAAEEYHGDTPRDDI